MDMIERTHNIVDWIRNSIDYAVVVEDFERKCESIILKNLQHTRRGTIEEVLDILRQRISLDEAIRKIKEL